MGKSKKAKKALKPLIEDGRFKNAVTKAQREALEKDPDANKKAFAFVSCNKISKSKKIKGTDMPKWGGVPKTQIFVGYIFSRIKNEKKRDKEDYETLCRRFKRATDVKPPKRKWLETLSDMYIDGPV